MSAVFYNDLRVYSIARENMSPIIDGSNYT